MPVTNVVVRTRGPRATFQVTCLDGQIHRFTMSADGTLDNPHHDADEDAVIAALGGAPHPCGRAHLAYQAALIAANASSGRSDDPAARYSQRSGWRSGEPCPTCRGTAEHVNSVAHQLHLRGIDDLHRPAETLRRWIERNHPAPRPYRKTSELLADFPRLNVDSSRWLGVYRNDLLTRAFVTAGTVEIGMSIHDVISLRRSGISTQWLTALADQLSPQAKRKLRGRMNRKVAVLAAARNVSPSVIAAYLNAGIYGHLHTYARAHAQPADIIAVYRAEAPGTLADMLRAGMTVHEALVAVGVRSV